MGIERYLDKTEAFLEVSFANLTEALWFKKAETAGTIRVLDAFPDRKYFPGFDMVILDFGKLVDWDESPAIYRVKKDLVVPGSIVEVIIKRAKVDTSPKAVLTAIRPFEKEKYGKDFGMGDLTTAQMFGYNMKYSSLSKMFFDRFVEERRRKEPPIRF